MTVRLTARTARKIKAVLGRSPPTAGGRRPAPGGTSPTAFAMCDSGTSSGNDPGGTACYPGTLVGFPGDNLTDTAFMGPVWISFANAGGATTGQFYEGHLSGVCTVAGDTRPRLVVVAGDAGGGNALCTSSTPVALRYYPALLMDESPPAPGVPTTTQIWLTERNGGALYAGRKYGFDRYGKGLFLGARHAATTDDLACCAPAPGDCVDGCTHASAASWSGYVQICHVSGSDPLDMLSAPWDRQPAYHFGGDGTVGGRTGNLNNPTGTIGFNVSFLHACSMTGPGGSSPSSDYAYQWQVRYFADDFRLYLRRNGETTWHPFGLTDPTTADNIGGPYTYTPTACNPFCFSADFDVRISGVIGTYRVYFFETGATCVPGACGSGGASGAGCYTTGLFPTIKVPASWTCTFAVTSGSCTPDPDGDPVTFNFFNDNGTVLQMFATFTLNGRDAYAVITFGHGATTGTVQLFWANDEGGGSYTEVDGTATLSGGVWTMSVTGIDTGDGCVVSLGGTFDTATCA